LGQKAAGLPDHELPSWPARVQVIIGLVIGTEIGAGAANRMEASTLRAMMVVFVMAIVMS
jgi:uncharacterized membrane protein YfcA